MAPITPPAQPIDASLKGKTVLITGGTGSFGGTMCRRLLATGIGEVRIFSRDELKQELMRNELNDERVRFYLGDVRIRESVDNAMKDVDYVFHAAALKQVPSCEFFPMQAVLTNIVGSHHVIESATAHKVGRVVCLSTDKAVYPINAMGMTKALMEKVAQAAARAAGERDTVVSSVRYGNVMYSRGSVIPLFVKQVRDGRDLTVTNPAMTRFMLSLTNAIELVLHAFGHAEPGDVFIRKSPACTVGDLAQAVINLFGVQAGVRSIGVRHGEKLYETLATKEELANAEDMGEYYRVRMDVRTLNYEKYVTEGDAHLGELDDYHSHNTVQLNVREVESLLRTLPEIQQALASA
jgi:UDP-glucose 4-epimerase